MQKRDQPSTEAVVFDQTVRSHNNHSRVYNTFYKFGCFIASLTNILSFARISTSKRIVKFPYQHAFLSLFLSFSFLFHSFFPPSLPSIQFSNDAFEIFIPINRADKLSFHISPTSFRASSHYAFATRKRSH